MIDGIAARGRRIGALTIASLLLAGLVVAVSSERADAVFPGADGDWIVVESQTGEAPLSIDLLAIRHDGTGTPTNLTAATGFLVTDPAFSPDGRKLAFVWNFEGHDSIYVADFDPTGPSIGAPASWVQVTTGGPDGTDNKPTWSPGMTTIAFERLVRLDIVTGTATADDATGTTLTDSGADFTTLGVLEGMTVENLRTGATGTVETVGTTTLTTTPLEGGDPDDEWKDGDGYEIYHHNRRIFSAPVAGGPHAGDPLSDAGAGDLYDDRAPAWAPDNSRIAFESDRLGNFKVFLMGIDGADETALTGALPQHARRPSWSPNAAEITFHYGLSGTDGEFDRIRRIDVATESVITVFTPTDGDNARYPTFSPTGAEIAFKLTGSGGDTLRLMNADGSGVHEVNAVGAPHDKPDWQPVLGAEPDAYGLAQGATLNVAAPGVLANDGPALAAALGGRSASLVSGPSHASSFTLNANGSFTYTHNGSSTASDSFTYRPVQGDVMGPTVAVNLTIALDDPPPPEDSVGLVDPAQGFWRLYRPNGSLLTSFFYGNPGDVPFMGDWNCDGIDTPGMYRQSDGFVYLRNTNTQGNAHIRFFFGNPGDIPIAGDFNGDGCDTVSIYRPSEGRFFIINKLGANEGGLGAADFSYFFGNLGDKPFIGDFNGNGIDTVGLHRESTGLVYFRNSHTQGVADHEFIFGNPADRLVAGDWGIVDGVDTPAVYRPATTTFFFRHTNTQGIADHTFTVGQPTFLPVAGVFE